MKFATSLTAEALLTLIIAVGAIAAALIVEHILTGHRGWAPRWYYAEGLVTVLIGLAAWLAVEEVTVDLFTAILIVVAGCVSGVPDFILLRSEQQRERDARWQQLAALNQDLAARLALLERLGGGPNSHACRRLQELSETMSFALGAAKLEIDQLELFLGQATPILGPIIAAARATSGDAQRPAYASPEGGA